VDCERSKGTLSAGKNRAIVENLKQRLCLEGGYVCLLVGVQILAGFVGLVPCPVMLCWLCMRCHHAKHICYCAKW